MTAKVWRFFVAAFDWRTVWRKITGQPIIDVVFISNMRDEIDRNRYLGDWHPSEGHFNGPRYWFNGIAGRTRAIDSTTQEMGTIKGRRRAKEQFLAATRWSEAMGAKVILFAAATKRLFDEAFQKDLKKMFPKLIFTIGDNGTFLLLKRETVRALDSAGLNTGHSRIAILGPYGLLGEMMVRTLKRLGYDVVGAGPNVGGLERVSEKYGIKTYKSFTEMGEVDAVIGCTHSEDIQLTAKNVELIRRQGKKLLVVDVAKPENFPLHEYQSCRQFTVRQDAGNAYSSKLKYVLGAISYRMFRLTRGVAFGCFAESLSIAAALKRGENVRAFNWLTVSDETMIYVAEIFTKDGFGIPSPRCFSQSVTNFNLNLESGESAENRFSLKVAAEKLLGFLF